jgi:glycosyltransferase involved in cell wall biosynthesis
MTDRLLLILIPAFNEEGAVGSVIQSVRAIMAGVPILVVDDCSTDGTISTAKGAGAEVLGFLYVIRVDGDGQHEAADIPRIFEALRKSGCEMVIGSRFLNGGAVETSTVRLLGIRFFRLILRPILGKVVSDPTSGFLGVNRNALQVFSRSFPLEYPEIETLVVLQRKAFRFEEVPCRFHPRKTGKSSITPLKSIYYIVHVLLGVFINVLRLPRFR